MSLVQSEPFQADIAWAVRTMFRGGADHEFQGGADRTIRAARTELSGRRGP